MNQKTRAQVKDELREMIAARLNVRARSFDAAVNRAGRLLPQQARSAAAEIRALEARMAHPRLAARTDPALFQHAADSFRLSLSAYPPGERAGRQRALLLAEIGFKIAVVMALGLAFLYWQAGA
jgi:hypothetical protein